MLKSVCDAKWCAFGFLSGGAGFGRLPDGDERNQDSAAKGEKRKSQKMTFVYTGKGKRSAQADSAPPEQKLCAKQACAIQVRQYLTHALRIKFRNHHILPHLSSPFTMFTNSL